MAQDRVPAGYFDARDALRVDAARAVTALSKAGLRVLMLTGDSVAAAKPIAAQAGITEVEAGPGPGRQAGSHPRLATERPARGHGRGRHQRRRCAGTGGRRYRHGFGADLAQEAGRCVATARPALAIPAALGNWPANLRIHAPESGLGSGLQPARHSAGGRAAVSGFHILLTPWLAAAAMALSSVCVLANSLRLRGWQPSR